MAKRISKKYIDTSMKFPSRLSDKMPRGFSGDKKLKPYKLQREKLKM